MILSLSYWCQSQKSGISQTLVNTVSWEKINFCAIQRCHRMIPSLFSPAGSGLSAPKQRQEAVEVGGGAGKKGFCKVVYLPGNQPNGTN